MFIVNGGVGRDVCGRTGRLIFVLTRSEKLAKELRKMGKMKRIGCLLKECST